MKKAKGSGISILLAGIMFLVLAVIMTVHDASYLFLGKTSDLNEIIKNGEEFPRGKYVTYTCEYPMGVYGTEQDYYGGIIPAGRKSYYYAIYDDSGIVFSASANSGKLKDDIDAVGNYEKDSVELKGCIKTIDSKMMGFLEDMFGEDIDEENVPVSYYVIDTTQTRPMLFVLYGGSLLMGSACIALFISKKRKQRF